MVTAEGPQELRTVDDLERLGFLRVTRVSARGAEVTQAEARLTEQGATALELDGGWVHPGTNGNGGRAR